VIDPRGSGPDPPGEGKIKIGKHAYSGNKAEQGNLAYIHELIDRLDGKAVQVVDRQDLPIHELSDAELYRIAAGGGMNAETMLLIPPAKVRSDDPT
jgi:hypothetical protein